jgi:hypothetical protein
MNVHTQICIVHGPVNCWEQQGLKTKNIPLAFNRIKHAPIRQSSMEEQANRPRRRRGAREGIRLSDLSKSEKQEIKRSHQIRNRIATPFVPNLKPIDVMTITNPLCV